MRIISLAVLLLVMGSPSHGGEVDLSGSVEFQARFFRDDPVWIGQDDRALQGSIAFSADIGWYSESGDQRASFIPYLRWDATDEEASLVDLQEAYWAFEGDD